MSGMHNKLWSFTLLLLLPVLVTAQNYQRIDLGIDDSQAYSINNRGDIVGVGKIDGACRQAFILTGSSILRVGPEGVCSSQARDINDSGQVIGYSYPTGSISVAFLWQNGVNTQLPPLPGGTWCEAHAINAIGQITGRCQDSTGSVTAVIWDGGIPTSLGVPPGGTESEGRDINIQGQVIGMYTGTGGSWRPLVFAEGSYFDLSVNGRGLGISDDGIAVGWLRESGPVAPFAWRDSVLWELPINCPYGTAWDINESGWVAGECKDPADIGGGLAFVHNMSDGETIILPSTARYTAAVKLNFSGEAVGWYLEPDGKPRAVAWSRNRPPVADAGADQAVLSLGVPVQLDGSTSYDLDGDPLTFFWSFHAKPPGSIVTLSNPTAVAPTFVPDLYGSYELHLVVADPWTASEADAMLVSLENLPPSASAGLDTSAIIGFPVLLDGSGSSDPNGDPITYQWSILELPAGSLVTLDNASSAQTSFVPDVAGTYRFELRVNDGVFTSVPSVVAVEAVSQADAAISKVMEIQDLISAAAPRAFKNPQLQNRLLQDLNAVISMLESEGGYQGALAKMESDIISVVDGCKGGNPANDVIDACVDKEEIYLQAVALAELLRAFLAQ